MKKINDLTIKKNAKLDEMRSIVEQVIAENRTKDEDETKRYNALDKEVKTIEAQIKEFEQLEELNKRDRSGVVDVKSKDEKSLAERFMNTLKEADSLGRMSKFVIERADPILSSTDTGVILKDVRPEGIDVITSPGEAFLRNLGVTFYPNLVGNFTLPSMGEATAGFTSEGADSSSASMGSSSVTLSARPISISQAVTKATLLQTSPNVFQSILNNLIAGIWNGVSKDFFVQCLGDCAGQVNTPTVAGLVYADVIKMEASLGGLDVNPGTTAYLTTPSGKAYLKNKIALGTTVGPAVWNNDEMNGYKAYSTPHLAANKLVFGDFSKFAIGQWGGIEIVIDPFSKAASQQIVVTAQGLFDSGAINKRGITYADVSIGY